MLKLQTLTLGNYQTNCYIVYEENAKTCVVIDPGYQPEAILQALEELSLSLEAILLTHGHFDHVGGVKILAADTGCRVYLPAEDLSLPEMLTAGPLFYTDTYENNSSLSLAGLNFRVLHTPGHTPGSVCLICEKHIFSGDTLFAGSCGRTDLPGGDWTSIRKSLLTLRQLEGEFAIHPGHGESTTLALEKQYNPYMQ